MQQWRLLSVNLWVLPIHFCGRKLSFVRTRLNELLKTTSQYDVLCFQGFFKTGTRKRYVKDFIKRLRIQGFIYSITGPNQECSAHLCILNQGGLAVFSKYPIKSYEKVSFVAKKYTNDPFVNRGFLYCEVNLSNPGNIQDEQIIQILNTELKTKCHWKQEKKRLQYELTVRDQWRQLANFIRYSVTAETPIFICGDFGIDGIKSVNQNNIQEDQKQYKSVLQKIIKQKSLFESFSQIQKQIKSNIEQLNVSQLVADSIPSMGRACSDNYKALYDALNIFGDSAQNKNKYTQNSAHNDSDQRDKTIKSQTTEPTMRLIDLAYDAYSAPPVTFGDVYFKNGQIMPRETLLTNKNDLLSVQRRDFVFTFDNQKAAFPNVQAKYLISTSPQVAFISGRAAIEVIFHFL